MNNLSEKQIIEIAEKSISKIKISEGANLYKNLAFVDKIFEGYDSTIINEIKQLVKEDFQGNLQVNLFESSNLSTYHHIYNYLYEHNLLSKYNEIADYMNYPTAGELTKKKA